MWRKPFQYVYAQIVSDNNSESVTKTRYIIFNIITEKNHQLNLVVTVFLGTVQIKLIY